MLSQAGLEVVVVGHGYVLELGQARITAKCVWIGAGRSISMRIGASNGTRLEVEDAVRRAEHKRIDVLKRREPM